MRKLVFIFISLFFLYTASYAQNMTVKSLPSEIFKTIKKDSDTTKWVWKKGGLSNFNLSQSSQDNWASGGDNFSMSLSSYFNYFIFYKKKKHTWDNNLDFNLGFVQTTSLGNRKNDDRIDILSKYGYRVDSSGKLFISGLYNLRTQFFDGYKYSGTVGTLTSTFFSPAYSLLSLGIDYKPFKDFSAFISPFTSRATIVTNKRLNKQGVYGVPAGHSISNSIGAFSSINYAKSFGKNVSYKGRLDLFSDYKNNPKNVDVYMTNLLSFKINKYISSTYSLDLIYDDDVKQFGEAKSSPALQVKSTIGIGLALKLNPVVKK